MSRLITGISGAVALSLISGAAQFALGSDRQSSQSQFSQQTSSGASSPTVNRGAKADRASSPSGSPAQTQTVALRLSGFSDTSFLLRVSVASGDRPQASSPAKPGVRKPTVACEPVVSVLTEVARQLEPGRCVT